MITIKKAKKDDIKAIVKIHMQAFPDFFLTTLGFRFLLLYYKCMCRSQDAVTICAEEDGIIVGFATSSFYSRGFNAALIKNNLYSFSLMGFVLLLSKPRSFIRLFRNLEKKPNPNIDDYGDYAELYSIAVSPKYQGRGIGKRLVLAIEEEIIKHNTKLSLTTDYYNNEKTIGFYHSLGYQNYYEFITYPNRRMWRMIKKLR